MWTRKELKDRAKAVLRKIYWSAFGVSIVIAIAGGNDGFGGKGSYHSSNSSNSHNFNFYNNFSFYDNFNYHNNHFWSWENAFAILLFILIAFALRIFIGYCLEVGGRKYFVQSAQYRDNKGCFSFSFEQQNYMKIVKTMLFRDIYIFLWTLLLIIPGIIKSYAYRMVPYILADNPNMGVNKALELSNEMTMGHKFEMFVLDLSFIGWYFLGALALGIGVFFVMPYENATNAELYLVLRQNALEANMCSYNDLSLNHPGFNNNNDNW